MIENRELKRQLRSALIWQTQRCEEHNKRLMEENKQLKKDIQDKDEIIELYQGFCGKR